MARDAGANKVYLTSAAPPIRYPNIYGIDIPTRKELVAYERNEEEIAKILGCDWIVYQRLNDLEESIRESGEIPEQGMCCVCGCSIGVMGCFSFIPVYSRLLSLLLPTVYESSCFSGKYVTGEDIDSDYFSKLHEKRNDTAKEMRRLESGAAQVGLPPGSNDGCENLSNDKRGRA